MSAVIIAIDGKTARRSFKTKERNTALHSVSAWSCQHQLVLGQTAVDEKSNEITAIPALLNLLALNDEYRSTLLESGIKMRYLVRDCNTEYATLISNRQYLVDLIGLIVILTGSKNAKNCHFSAHFVCAYLWFWML